LRAKHEILHITLFWRRRRRTFWFDGVLALVDEEKEFFSCLFFYSVRFCSVKRDETFHMTWETNKHDAYILGGLESDIDVGRVSLGEAANRVYGFIRAEYNVG